MTFIIGMLAFLLGIAIGANISHDSELILWRLTRIMATQEETLAKLTLLGEKLDNIQADIDALQELVNETDNVPQTIVDAIDALVAKASTVADDVP